MTVGLCWENSIIFNPMLKISQRNKKSAVFFKLKTNFSQRMQKEILNNIKILFFEYLKYNSIKNNIEFR